MRVRFSPPAHENRYWWTILECDGRFMVCMREHVAGRRPGVEAVGGDGSITVSEANVGGQVGPFRRTISSTDAGLVTFSPVL